MNPVDLVRTLLLFRRLKKGMGETQIQYYQHCLPDGTLLDIYRNSKKERSLWILLPGMTIVGPRHPNLIHFAKSLAHEGITCVVPKLNGLSACRWELNDLEQLDAVIAFGYREINYKVGLLGFCNGGSYALVIASREQAAQKIHRVITIGAYHHLNDLINSYLDDFYNQQKSDMQLEHEIYRYMVIMYGYGDRNLLSPSVWEELQFMLGQYPVNTSISKKKQFYNRYLQHLDFAAMLEGFLNHRNFDALSPAGKISGISPPVTIIHAKNDLVASPDHADRIYAELQRAPEPGKHQLMITSAFSHATPARMEVREFKRLCHVFSPVMEKYKFNNRKNEEEF